jgi:NADPH:quinone reductase-like Zn-dependent oxidoreductase
MPPLAGFPSVLGSDIGGVVVAAGSSISSDAPKPGTRVAAFAPTFFVQGAPDYGAFQKFAMVPAVNVAQIPDSMSFNEASLLPMAVVTAWSGFYSIGLPRNTHYSPADKQGLIVWGGASSVGSAVIQVAKTLGFSIYVTASEKHAAYLATLGATHVFDYKDPDVVSNIVAAAKADGVQINLGYDAVGQLPLSASVLVQAKTVDTAKLASAVFPARVAGWGDTEVPGVHVTFVEVPTDAEERTEHLQFIIQGWLQDKLTTREFVPSPKIKVVPGGLEALNEALDILKAGVSGEKVVVEI